MKDDTETGAPAQSGSTNNIRALIGCAGWNIPKAYGDRFPREGSHLERYSQVFSCVEINSSFYRPHKPATYERWAAAVPPNFRFSVKVPRTITHFRRLRGIDAEFNSFMEEVSALGPKLGPLLVQLPPTFAFDMVVVGGFLDVLHEKFSGEIACEPRHPSWFGDKPSELMANYNVARVAADPSVLPEAAEPAGSTNLLYYRLHGSPRIYYSGYTEDYLRTIADKITEAITKGSTVWCIFDNTAEGAATGDALSVIAKLSTGQGR